MTAIPEQSGGDEVERPEPKRARLPHAALAVGQAIMDIVLPPLCLGCDERIDGHNSLCPACWRNIDFIRAPLCDRLGLPLPYGTSEPLISAAAAADPPAYDRARAVARFNDLLRDMVHDLKFRDSHNARRLFGRWLCDAGHDVITGAEVIIPVPLARSRLLFRRFNQAQILADEIGRLSGVRVDAFALTRARSTKHQVGLSRAARRRNVAGAFAVPSHAYPRVAGAAVLLVDDVITTGATVGAAATALKKAGARRVDVLALGLVTDALK